MHPKFHAFLYDYFIKGHDLDRIASDHESSWYEVAEVLDSEPARTHMRRAIRVERLRDVAQDIANRRLGIRTLTGIIMDRSLSSVGPEGRRRAADAILRSTKPARTSSGRAPASPRPPRTQPAQPPQSENQKPAANRAPDSKSLPGAPSAERPISHPKSPADPARERVRYAAPDRKPSQPAAPTRSPASTTPIERPSSLPHTQHQKQNSS